MVNFDVLLQGRTKNVPGEAYKLAGTSYGMDTPFIGQMEIDESEMSIVIPFADGVRRDGVGDLLEVAGIDCSRHKNNPVALFDHAKSVNLPIGQIEDPKTRHYCVHIDPVMKTAKAKVFFYQGRKAIQQEGFEPEHYARVSNSQNYDHAVFCEQLFDMMVKRYIRAGSIGYQVITARELPPDYTTGTPKGLHLLKTLLLEVSAVVLPANQDTVAKALSLPKICGKPISPMLVKSLAPYAPAHKAQMGYEGKANRDSRGPDRAKTTSHGWAGSSARMNIPGYDMSAPPPPGRQPSGPDFIDAGAQTIRRAAAQGLAEDLRAASEDRQVGDPMPGVDHAKRPDDKGISRKGQKARRTRGERQTDQEQERQLRQHGGPSPDHAKLVSEMQQEMQQGEYSPTAARYNVPGYGNSADSGSQHPAEDTRALRGYSAGRNRTRAAIERQVRPVENADVPEVQALNTAYQAAANQPNPIKPRTFIMGQEVSDNKNLRMKYGKASTEPGHIGSTPPDGEKQGDMGAGPRYETMERARTSRPRSNADVPEVQALNTAHQQAANHPNPIKPRTFIGDREVSDNKNLRMKYGRGKGYRPETYQAEYGGNDPKVPYGDGLKVNRNVFLNERPVEPEYEETRRNYDAQTPADTSEDNPQKAMSREERVAATGRVGRAIHGRDHPAWMQGYAESYEHGTEEEQDRILGENRDRANRLGAERQTLGEEAAQAAMYRPLGNPIPPKPDTDARNDLKTLRMKYGAKAQDDLLKERRALQPSVHDSMNEPDPHDEYSARQREVRSRTRGQREAEIDNALSAYPDNDKRIKASPYAENFRDDIGRSPQRHSRRPNIENANFTFEGNSEAAERRDRYQREGEEKYNQDLDRDELREDEKTFKVGKAPVPHGDHSKTDIPPPKWKPGWGKKNKPDKVDQILASEEQKIRGEVREDWEPPYVERDQSRADRLAEISKVRQGLPHHGTPHYGSEAERTEGSKNLRMKYAKSKPKVNYSEVGRAINDELEEGIRAHQEGRINDQQIAEIVSRAAQGARTVSSGQQEAGAEKTRQWMNTNQGIKKKSRKGIDPKTGVELTEGQSLDAHDAAYRNLGTGEDSATRRNRMRQTVLHGEGESRGVGTTHRLLRRLGEDVGESVEDYRNQFRRSTDQKARKGIDPKTGVELTSAQQERALHTVNQGMHRPENNNMTALDNRLRQRALQGDHNTAQEAHEALSTTEGDLGSSARHYQNQYRSSTDQKANNQSQNSRNQSQNLNQNQTNHMQLRMKYGRKANPAREQELGEQMGAYHGVELSNEEMHGPDRIKVREDEQRADVLHGERDHEAGHRINRAMNRSMGYRTHDDEGE